MKKNGLRGGEGLATYLTALMVALMVGCKPAERVVYAPKTHTIETIIRDTIVEVRIPEHYAERETLDTISELSNPFAYSRAMVSQGKLTHSLGIKEWATVKEEIVITETITRDTIGYPVEVEVIREVEKPLRWWQVSLMWVGVVAIVVASVVVYKKIRRPFS